MSAPLLQVAGLTRRFGGLTAVDGLDLAVGAGEIVGLLGPNGSGKTTAINLISGAIAADSGTTTLRGSPIHGLPPHRIARKGVARTFQLVRAMPSLSVRENVLVGLAFGRRIVWAADARREADALLERVGLGGRGDAQPGELTYIDQKRLELARALGGRPELLLLDEWLAGLNPTELQQGVLLIRSLRDEGLSILMVEHVMDAIRSLCDRVAVMNVGRKIAEGAPQAVLADPAVIAAYLGDETEAAHA